MQRRIESPVQTVDGALPALLRLAKSTTGAGIPEVTHKLVELRASQINGCSVCVDMHWRELKQLGESDTRVAMVSAWRESPYFSERERAALDLTEAATRLADRPDAVPDEVWDEAARHYTEPQLAALVLMIAGINAWNRINAVTRQISGDWVEQWIQPAREAA